MNKDPNATGYEDVRRAGLNPAADYGGDVEWRSAGRKAIQEAVESGELTDESGQLSLLDTNGEAREDLQPKRRALGSRALSASEMAAAPAPEVTVDRLTYEDPRYSQAANKSQKIADDLHVNRKKRR